MEVLEGKKIVIRIPRFCWKSLFSLRFGAVLLLLVGAAGFFYWYSEIRPFFWISEARVESYSISVCSGASGRIAEIGPQEGEAVLRGKLLFGLDREQLAGQREEIQRSIVRLKEGLRSEKLRMENAMNEYLSLNEEMSDEMAQHLAILEEGQIKSEGAASQLEAAEKNLSLIDQQIKKMIFVSPFDGVVLKRGKDSGERVELGEKVYFLSDPSHTWIEAQIPEQELSRVSVGTIAKIRVPAYPEREWLGKVSWVGPATVSKIESTRFSKQKETIPVKISFESSGFHLKPGLSAEVGLKVH
jgi:HlyD family secretion protein